MALTRTWHGIGKYYPKGLRPKPPQLVLAQHLIPGELPQSRLTSGILRFINLIICGRSSSDPLRIAALDVYDEVFCQFLRIS